MKKSNLLASAIALTGLFALASSVHAQSVDVSVIGTIEPAACIPTISGGGVIDYGVIAASTLNSTSFNVLPARTGTFTINCDAPAQVGITAADNRAASRVPGAVAAINAAYTDVRNFGLGTVSGANVGGYIMQLAGVNVDAANNVPRLLSTNGGATWAAAGGVLYNDNAAIMSWGASAAAGVTPGEVITGNFIVQAVLNKGSDLPLTSDVPLDGSATLTLVYL